ncbi:MAG: hypothetical protein ACKO3I_02900 [Synechococcales cyanobacterium]
MLDASLTDAIKDGEHLLASQPNDNLFVTVDSLGQVTAYWQAP